MSAQFEPDTRQSEANFWCTFALMFVLFGILSGPVSIWHYENLPIVPSGRYALFIGSIFFLFGLRLANWSLKSLKFDISGAGWVLVLVFFSDWLTRVGSFYDAPNFRGELIVGAGLGWFLIRNKVFNSLWLLLPIAIIILAACFLAETGGNLIFSDDHPTFLYRLMLLKENFPRIPFYNPLWNSGLDARDFFATGALNFFLLFSPLIYSLDLANNYTFLVGLLLFALAPGLTYLAARLAHAKSPLPAIAATLVLISGLIWYRWALKYGTLGFITSLSLVPLNLVLAARLLGSNTLQPKWIIGLALASFSLMFCWSLSAVVFIPALLWGVFKLPQLVRRKDIICLCLGLVILNGPWVTLFWSVSNVGKFVQNNQPSYESMYQQGEKISAPATTPRVLKHRPKDASFKRSMSNLRDSIRYTNPLLIFLGIGGLIYLTLATRHLFCATLLWLIFLGAVLAPVKPQFELDRMLLVATYCLALPAAYGLASLCREAQATRRLRQLLPGALALGFLMVGPLASGSVLRNRTIEQYYSADKGVFEMQSAIEKYAGPGRVLFSGFVLHELSHGHLAPLAMLTKKPLIASSPFHDRWMYQQVFPKPYIGRGEAGIEEYLDLHNVTAVMAHEPYWRDYFSKRPEVYTKTWQGDRFRMYERATTASYFLGGTGKVLSQTSSKVTFLAESPEVILKFNYFNWLESSDCVLSPFSAGPGLTFIKLSGCPTGTPIEIESGSPWRRLLRG